MKRERKTLVPLRASLDICHDVLATLESAAAQTIQIVAFGESLIAGVGPVRAKGPFAPEGSREAFGGNRPYRCEALKTSQRQTMSARMPAIFACIGRSFRPFSLPFRHSGPR